MSSLSLADFMKLSEYVGPLNDYLAGRQSVVDVFLTPGEKEIDAWLRTTERGLNVAGCVPFIHTISAQARLILGEMLIITAIVVAVVVAGKAFFNPNDEEQEKELNFAKGVVITYLAHGVVNVGLSFVESSLVLAWITMITWRCVMGNRFAYPHESVVQINKPQQQTE
jgi:hypothetical protein